VTLVVSLGVAFLVSACLLVASGAGGIGLLHLVADVARKRPVIAALATGAAVLPCARPLLRVFREEDHSQSHDAAAAAASSRSTGTGRFGNMTQVASFTGVAAVVGTMLLALFTRKASNAAGAGGRAAPTPAADTRRVGGKLTTLAPYLAVVSFVALICCIVLTTYAPLETGPDGAKDPRPCSA
jgi:hypothetical protein